MYESRYFYYFVLLNNTPGDLTYVGTAEWRPLVTGGTQHHHYLLHRTCITIYILVLIVLILRTGRDFYLFHGSLFSVS